MVQLYDIDLRKGINMNKLNKKRIGIIWSSNKPNEKRYPLDWRHLKKFTTQELELIYFESGYPDIHLSKVYDKLKFLSREDIFKMCDIVVITKLVAEDYKYIKDSQIIFGWLHCVQSEAIVELAVRKKLTLISFENMYVYTKGSRRRHVFCRNNELAGYSGVNNFMSTYGITPGAYGKQMKIAVLGYGSTAKGALTSLLGLGATDVTVFSKRSIFEIGDAIKGINYKKYTVNGGEAYIDDELAFNTLNDYDLIVNCIFQNPISPTMFLREKQIVSKKEKIKIIDISCDEAMGFDFAKPTEFDDPIIYGDHFIYYSVDNLPSLYYKAASFEISGAVTKYIKRLCNTEGFENSKTLQEAVDIKKGVIINEDIIEFQEKDN